MIIALIRSDSRVERWYASAITSMVITEIDTGLCLSHTSGLICIREGVGAIISGTLLFSMELRTGGLMTDLFGELFLVIAVGPAVNTNWLIWEDGKVVTSTNRPRVVSGYSMSKEPALAGMLGCLFRITYLMDCWNPWTYYERSILHSSNNWIFQ